MSFGTSAPAFLLCAYDKTPAECCDASAGVILHVQHGHGGNDHGQVGACDDRDHLRRGVDTVCKMAVAGNYQTDHTRCQPEFMTLF